MKLKHKEATITGGSYKFTLPAFPRPVFADTLKFPQDITELETENVSDLLGKYTQML